MPARQRYRQFSDANLRGNFFSAFEDTQAASYVTAISMRIDSDQEFEKFGWLGTPPVMREWKGGRQIRQPNEFSWTLWNKKYESSIQISVDDWNRDKTGQLAIYAQGLGQRAAENPIILMTDLLVAGESSLCFDGQYFFDTDHNEGGGTNVNTISVDLSDLPVATHGTVATPSDEEMEKVILKGIKQFMSFKDDQGRPVNQGARRFAVIAPIGMMDAVLAATSNTVMASGRQNTLTSATGFSIVPYFDASLPWTNKLAIVRLDHPVRPFIHQVETDNQISQITDPNAEYVIMNDAYFWGVKRSEAVGYGDYKKAVLVTLVA